MASILQTGAASGKQMLQITGYSDPKYTSEIGTITVMLNPTEISHSLSNNFGSDDSKPIGTLDVSKTYKSTDAETFKFELMFDGTGVVNGNTATDVATMLNSFYSTCYYYNGDVHEPNYLKVVWGNIMFKGRLTSCDITYSLFTESGAPLRAKANVTFEQYIDAETLKTDLNENSPDMTHLRVVKKGDSLPKMCKDIYGDSSYYLQVAAINNLNSLRVLIPGQKILFPPIKK